VLIYRLRFQEVYCSANFTFKLFLVSSCMYRQGYHFSGYLEMSGNSAKVRKVRRKAQSQGKVREFV